jgi:hypothetical protein
MGIIRRITARDKPEELAVRAQRCAARLTDAVAIALRRARRNTAGIQPALASARVEGFSRSGTTKTAVVTFGAAPFNGNLHVMWGWHQIDQFTDSELASQLSHVLREGLRRKTAGSSQNVARRRGGSARRRRTRG